MNRRFLVIAAAFTTVLSFNTFAEAGAEQSAAVDQTTAPATGIPMTAAEMQQRMQQMRRQHMEKMQAQRQAMPMMGPRNGRLPPEMLQRMQEMHQQRVQMMQASRPAMPPMGGPSVPQGEAAAQPPAPSASQQAGNTAQPMSCAERHAMMGKAGGYGRNAKGGMQGKGKKRMMQMKRQHMQRMEERLANIESLMRELVELQKQQ